MHSLIKVHSLIRVFKDQQHDSGHFCDYIPDPSLLADVFLAVTTPYPQNAKSLQVEEKLLMNVRWLVGLYRSCGAAWLITGTPYLVST